MMIGENPIIKINGIKNRVFQCQFDGRVWKVKERSIVGHLGFFNHLGVGVFFVSGMWESSKIPDFCVVHFESRNYLFGSGLLHVKNSEVSEFFLRHPHVVVRDLNYSSAYVIINNNVFHYSTLIHKAINYVQSINRQLHCQLSITGI